LIARRTPAIRSASVPVIGKHWHVTLPGRMTSLAKRFKYPCWDIVRPSDAPGWPISLNAWQIQVSSIH
jgi:hypothetical protein